MASHSSNTPVSTHPVNTIEQQPLLSVNANTQLPLKFTPTNYPSWRAQFVTLLIGYDLMGFIDGTLQCPSRGGPTQPPFATYTLWYRQDQLLLHAIFASVSKVVMPLIASVATSYSAWERLRRLYANKSRTHVMQLKEDLMLMHHGNKSVSDFLQFVKVLADELVVIDAPLSADDIMLYVLNGLGTDYFKEIVAPIRARENPLSFEEFHDLLVGHEDYLKRLEFANATLIATTNSTQCCNNQNKFTNKK
ncbi:hypothetical protein F2P56_014329 [Juglans regia]|uniref:Retrotransposon Copia-like N-terminal domain-containing protein n=1 Tax=Juglans regia TaxID=51240 RepID=A0A833XCY4_JUGRE|nr:hypothetical protein F2P56_014329 [Juglans regia]